MYIAFKRAQRSDWVGRLINLLTIPGIGFCHVAFLFDDGSSWSCRSGYGVAFGERITPQDFILMRLRVDSHQEARIKATCQRYVDQGWGYDHFGCLRFVLPFIPIKWSKHSLFCSEGCITVLQENHLLDRKRCPALYVDPNILSLIVASDKGLIFGASRGIEREVESV